MAGGAEKGQEQDDGESSDAGDKRRQEAAAKVLSIKEDLGFIVPQQKRKS